MAEKALPEATDVAGLREEMIETAKLLATPIDFDDLIERGVLGPRTGGWYELLRADLLPKHARRQAIAIKQVTKRCESRTFLKFGKKNAQATKLFKQLTGKPFKAE
jgi:hypothetical protein